MLRKGASILSLAVMLTLPWPTSVRAAPRGAVVAQVGAFGARGGVRAAPRFGPQARFGRPGFRPFPFHRFHRFPGRFRPFVGFGFAVPFYAPYYAPYYPYNPYCDPGSVYYYPPWCY
jgi:hypothetical protein